MVRLINLSLLCLVHYSSIQYVVHLRARVLQRPMYFRHGWHRLSGEGLVRKAVTILPGSPLYLCYDPAKERQGHSRATGSPLGHECKFGSYTNTRLV